MIIENKEGLTNSIQVSKLGNITPGDFSLGGIYFLLKNNTDEDIQVTIVPAGQNEPVTTTIYSGWNPELIKKVINAPEGLQYGY